MKTASNRHSAQRRGMLECSVCRPGAGGRFARQHLSRRFCVLAPGSMVLGIAINTIT